jgi:hypothetical protein
MSCYHYQTYEYWCAYNITTVTGDQISYMDCDTWRWYTHFYDDFYRN